MIIHIADLSLVCIHELHELCEDPTCEDVCHDADDLEPFEETASSVADADNAYEWAYEQMERDWLERAEE